MFDLFKKNTEEKASDVKSIREAILQSIKEQLRKAEGGEGNNIRGIQLYITCQPEEKHAYDAALYVDEENKFRNAEVQRIADDFAIDLPEEWAMDILFVDAPPSEAIAIPGVDAALFISTKKNVVQKNVTAYIKIRIGEAEKTIYTITSTGGKIYIGREKKVQTADGFYRENNIAFPEASADAANKFISRQHAHVEFDHEAATFCLFADEGGVPPRNKIKVRSVNNPAPIKLYSTNVGYPLQEGDQVLLGQSALIEFSYTPDEKA